MRVDTPLVKKDDEGQSWLVVDTDQDTQVALRLADVRAVETNGTEDGCSLYCRDAETGEAIDRDVRHEFIVMLGYVGLNVRAV